MKSLEHYRKRAHKRKTQLSLDAVKRLNLNSSYFDNYLHRSFSVLIEKFDLENEIGIVETYIDFNRVFSDENQVTKGRNKLYEAMICGRYEKGKYCGNLFFPVIFSMLHEHKSVIVLLDLLYYTPSEHKDTAAGEYECHATTLLITQVRGRQYLVYHFNPHGLDAVSTLNYTKYVSLRRRREIPTEYGVDIHVVKQFITSLNAWNNDGIFLHYDVGQTYNYIGPNLQIGDQFGICYLLQGLFIFELLRHYNTRCTVVSKKGLIKLPPHKRTLRNGNIQDIAMVAVSSILKELSDLFVIDASLGQSKKDSLNRELSIHQMRHYAKIEEVIVKKSHLYRNKIINSLIPFLTQNAIRKIVLNK